VRKIFKYVIPIQDESTHLFPVGAKFLSVGEQAGRLMLWALVTEEAHTLPVTVSVLGTGNPASHLSGYDKFVGSAQMSNGLVWHVFVRGWALALKSALQRNPKSCTKTPTS
jgi:hypothetical protein